jgi:hypothetical protein
LCGYGSIYCNWKLNEVSSNYANFLLWKDFIMYTYFSYFHISWNGINKIKSFVLTLYTCALFCISDTEQFCILDTERLADTTRYTWLIQYIKYLRPLEIVMYLLIQNSKLQRKTSQSCHKRTFEISYETMWIFT